VPVTELSRIAQTRRSFIEQTLPQCDSILEIGAFDNPIFRRELGDPVRYVDWFSRDELVVMHKDNPRRRPEMIVDIDYLVKSNRLAQHIPHKFDLICASHVIEHIPDVIRWFNELHMMLNDDGMVFLAVPDRRYTFDYFRNISTASEMVRAFQERLEIPSKWQLVDNYYYHQKVDLPALWKGVTPAKFQPRFDLGAAVDLAEKKSRTYTDCHCWVFSGDTFAQLLADLHSAGKCSFEIDRATDAIPQTNEFHVMLRKKRS